MKVYRLYNTIKHLKTKQITNRLLRLVKGWFFGYRPVLLKENIQLPNWNNQVKSGTSYLGKNAFRFLNLNVQFNDTIDWNYLDHGKLWAYNLNYFDFLIQPDMDPQEGLCLIQDYIKRDKDIVIGIDPYPISLRGINWIKFLSVNSITEPKINKTLFSHYNHLFNNLEYHLMGNHLLENGFSLIFGGYYFKNEGFYNKGFEILREELTEQLLEDGGHFERSPMYHQILLFRLLDTINLIQNNPWKGDNGLRFLEDKASVMLSWLDAMSFSDGSTPMFNDSAYGIAPSTIDLKNYATQLGIRWEAIKLSESGYRKAKGKEYEMFMDIGNIGPDYQPGHAHADTLSFVLRVRGIPLLVDCGVSTYEANQRRHLERSTSSHNTVTINGMNQSEIWAAFRVARRAYAKVINEAPGHLTATHDGYKRNRANHQRTFLWEKDKIEIIDEVEARPMAQAEAHFHFHPEIQMEIKGNSLISKQTGIVINFEGKNTITSEDYSYASGYNQIESSQKIIVQFSNKLTTRISL